jgi:RNA polymerase sigma-70 factor (ECF subfamily)
MEASPLTLPAHGREGDVSALPAAFERLFRAEFTRVASIAYRVLRDADEAQDVAQEAFLSFYRSQRADAPHAPAWLHAAAAHLALNAARSRGRRSKRETADAITPETAASDDPATAVTSAETRDEVRATLARLPERSATLLALRYSGLSYAEIAEALDVRASSVGTLLRRAEDSFRRELR